MDPLATPLQLAIGIAVGLIVGVAGAFLFAWFLGGPEVPRFGGV